MKRVLVLGSTNTDMIVRVPRIPRPGETVLGGEFDMAPGGKGANQAVAAARAGGAVTFVTRVGDDLFGHRAVRDLEGEGIDVRFVGLDRVAATGVALINVDASGENSIAVASGANARLSAADVEAAAAAFAAADIVLLQLESPLETVEAAARMARKQGVPVILDPAPARPLDDALLKDVASLTPNEHEAETLAGVAVRNGADAARAAARLRARGPGLVVVTMGDKGIYAMGEGFEGMMPAFKVTPVDTTAAGDVFNGALAVALAERMDLSGALRFAQAAAAISVIRPGAQPSAPTRAEIEAFLLPSAQGAI